MGELAVTLARANSHVQAIARNPWVDTLRILAAFGIVRYHSRYIPGRFIGYSGLIFFIVVATFYETQRTKPVKISVTAERLLLPWIFWSLAFGAVNVMQRDPVFAEGTFLAGTAPHLWYVPFIFAITCVIRFFKGRVAYPALLGLGLMIMTAAAWRQAADDAGPPFAQWVHAFPAALLGIVLAQRGQQWALLAGMAIGAMTLLLSLTGVGLPYTIGCGSAAFALTTKGAPPMSALVEKAAPLMFGVYLMHPIFLSIGNRVGLINVPQIVFAFISSLVAVSVLRRTAMGRRIT